LENENPEGEGRKEPHSSFAYYSHCDFLKHFSQRLPKESSQISEIFVPDPEMKYKNKIDGGFVYCSVKLHYYERHHFKLGSDAWL
jgi:hypothetical protein